MKKALFLSVVAFSVCASSPHYIAQQPVPTIYLSASEAAKSKQAVQDFKGAQERNSRAVQAWRDFHESYQAAHPDLPGLQFASDFRIAFSKKNLNGGLPWETVANLATVELSPEERQKAEFLYRDTLEARRLADQAQKNWLDYWHELVLDHVPPNPGSGGSVVTLPNGKSGTIPNPWGNGIVFTPDFRVAVPLQ